MFLDRTPIGVEDARRNPDLLAKMPKRTSSANATAAVAPPSASSSTLTTSTPPRYDNLFHAFRTIWQQEGFLGLYRGFITGLMGVSHGAVQFMTYEELKKRWNEHKEKRRMIEHNSTTLSTAPPSDVWRAHETICMSIISKSVAGLTTYPYQVLRSRMQASYGSARPTLRYVMMKTWREEGIVGFYRGVGVNLFKVLPAACTVFLVYEQMNGYFKRHATYVY